jgi:methionyl-tRNA synthetase
VSYYVTTPIYYVNAAPHLGHAYSTIGADVLARHMRQRGEDVFFLTGTDEHGEPVALAGEREGVTPRELADRNAQRFRDLMPQIGVEQDFFIRTSDPRHAEKVREVMQRVYDNGHVYSGTYEGWYCPRCADFKTDAELGPNNTCPIHHIELTWEKEDNWFFALSTFQEPLERLYAEREDFVLPRHRYNEALSFIKQGLQDVSCTRAKISWGVPAPWDESQVFYVWFDALLNYVSGLEIAEPGADMLGRFWPPKHQVMAKDILKFHAVIWPALLMAAGLELPRHLVIHGFLLFGGEKMSKSRGNVLDPFEVIERFGADALRFYLFREVSFGHDGQVSTEGFETRYATELANDYGNLASRTIAMVHRYRGGTAPAAAPDPALTSDFATLTDEVSSAMDRADLTAALEHIWSRIRRLNQFVEERAPWVLAKDESKADELDATLSALVEGLRVVTVHLHPYMPATTTKLLDALGQPDLALARAGYGAGETGSALAKIGPLFPKPS